MRNLGFLDPLLEWARGVDLEIMEENALGIPVRDEPFCEVAESEPLATRFGLTLFGRAMNWTAEGWL